MNIELYVAMFVVFVLGMLVAQMFRVQQKWILAQERELDKRSDTISELTDRLMAKNLDQYKLWAQTPDEVPPPIAEEPFDDSAVGLITGEEKVN